MTEDTTAHRTDPWPLPGSERPQVAEPTTAVDPTSTIELTVVLRRRAPLPEDMLGSGSILSAAQLAQGYGADPQDITALTSSAGAAGLTVGLVDLPSRRVQLSGPVSAAAALFGATLVMTPTQDVRDGAVISRRRQSGALTLPAALAGIVVAVLGLEDRPQARAHFRIARAATSTSGTAFTLPQIGTAYNFPAGTDGTGQTIALIELGGGFGPTDLSTFFTGINTATPSVTAVGVDGASNVAGADPQGADGEVLLDIEVSGALAPKATIVVYFAPNTDRGFLDAIATAVHATPTPTAVSISWGQSEDSWTAAARTAMDDAFVDAVALGVTVCVAAGDNGSSDNVSDGKAHVDFPASSPHVLACGGTSLHVGTNGLPTRETVWNDGSQGGATGGGISDVFPTPTWQAKAGVPGSGRGVPDVAGDADPETGYQVIVDGKALVIGGTSAVAPLWAALIARLAQSLGKPLGLAQPTLYTLTSGLRDITQGSNGAFSAGPGWDACTGLGVPNGGALLAALSAALPTPTPTPPG